MTRRDVLKRLRQGCCGAGAEIHWERAVSCSKRTDHGTMEVILPWIAPQFVMSSWQQTSLEAEPDRGWELTKISSTLKDGSLSGSKTPTLPRVLLLKRRQTGCQVRLGSGKIPQIRGDVGGGKFVYGNVGVQCAHKSPGISKWSNGLRRLAFRRK